MTNYANGKIYRLVCNETGEQYIGSTTQTLGKRLQKHIYLSRATGEYACKSKAIIERGKYDIVLIEDYPCDTREQLFTRERHFIETLPCTNKNIPMRSVSEWYQAKRDAIIENAKQYYEANRDTIHEKQKQYREANRDTLYEKQKQWREANNDSLREKQKKYYDANRDSILEKKKQYAKTNADAIREKQKRYHEANRDRLCEYQKQRREAKKAERESQLNHQK